MLYRTLSEAQAEYAPYSWIEKVILRVTLQGGQTYFRTYQFNSSRHKCKRCRNARHGVHGRLNSSGHICDICGNPYAGFVRQGRTNRTGRWETMRFCWSSSGRLH